jgi:hypothetical protein
MRGHRRTVALVFAVSLAATAAGLTQGPQAPAVRQIPGLTAKDAYPTGCVDCHVAGKDGDLRISAIMTKWTSAVPAALAEKAKGVSVDPLKIKGKHPAIPTVKANLPRLCLTGCHQKGSTIAPLFAALMHAIHLVGGTQNRFLTAYQGECTHCHKLDQKTGTWKMPSGVEK